MSIVTWVDRAQSTDGHFDPNKGYLLCEIDGETYAVSGRYAGIPDPEEAQQLVCALHEERNPPDLYVFDDEIPAYNPDMVTITGKRKRCVKATGYTFKRFKHYGSVALWIEAGKVENYPDPCDVCRCYKCSCGGLTE